MGEVEFIETVGADGQIAMPALSQFANTKVKIMVTPIQDNSERSKKFFKKYGVMDKETAAIYKDVLASRTISEPKTW